MKYKVGDKVRIIEKWVDGCCQNNEGRMDKWLGKVMTIKQVERGHYFMVEDQKDRGYYGWAWNDNCIAGLANNHKIVITSDGKETLAHLYEGNKVIKSATAKCSPDDTFDFNFGATLAFERLMNEEEKPMTFREKLEKEHPEDVGERYVGGCRGCPHGYGYEKEHNKAFCNRKDVTVEVRCRECWDRVIPEQKAEKKEKPKKEEPKYYNGKVVCVQSENDDYTVGKIYEFKDGTLVDDQGDVRYKGCLRVKHPSEIVNLYKFIPYVE